MTTLSSQAILRRNRITAALVDGPMNLHDLSRATFTSEPRLNSYLRAMRSETPKLIYIAKWQRYGFYGTYIPMYANGNRKDASKPEPLTKREENASWWKRIKGTERHDLVKAHRRAKDRVAAAVKKPNTWASALGVP